MHGTGYPTCRILNIFSADEHGIGIGETSSRRREMASVIE